MAERFRFTHFFRVCSCSVCSVGLRREGRESEQSALAFFAAFHVYVRSSLNTTYSSQEAACLYLGIFFSLLLVLLLRYLEEDPSSFLSPERTLIPPIFEHT